MLPLFSVFLSIIAERGFSLPDIQVIEKIADRDYYAQNSGLLSLIFYAP